MVLEGLEPGDVEEGSSFVVRRLSVVGRRASVVGGRWAVVGGLKSMVSSLFRNLKPET